MKILMTIIIKLNKKDLYYVNPEDAWKRIKIKYSENAGD